MRLTLESTVFDNKTTVMIEIADDCLNILDVVERMVVPVLVGYGFHPDSVKKYIEIDDKYEEEYCIGA